MEFLGFGRSPSQQNTIGDGNCGPRALCDQLNLDFPDFTWVKGRKDDQPSPSCPLFVGYFEESHFLGPHYQSVVPLRQGVVLNTIVRHGGFNGALHFEFAETSCSIASPGIEIFKF